MGLHSEIATMQPGDEYQDAQGDRWRVVCSWTEPVVVMERVQPGPPGRRTAGISGRLWDGFRKLAPTQAEGER